MDTIIDLLRSIDLSSPNFPPTVIYNEGWMLRVVLDWFSKQSNLKHLFNFHKGTTWYSEAQLPTPFRARRQGDKLAESRTNADGVIGHFEIGSRGKSDFYLLPTATQFVVLEAKISSKLSSGIERASDYDQAARNLACMAETLKITGREPDEDIGLGFYLVAPQYKIGSNTFPEMDRASIHSKVRDRVDSYRGEKEDWYRDWFLPMMDVVDIQMISWEEVIAFIRIEDIKKGELIQGFYEKCLESN